MNKLQKTFDDIVERTRAKPIGTAGSFSGLCQSHDDKSASLSITLENDRILLYCHTGCTIERICSSLGIEQSELFECSNEKQVGRPAVLQVAECEQKRKKAQINADGLVVFFSDTHNEKVTESKRYTYHKSDGCIAYHVIRSTPKDFRPLNTDGELSLNGVTSVPYKLPDLLHGT